MGALLVSALAAVCGLLAAGYSLNRETRPEPARMLVPAITFAAPHVIPSTPRLHMQVPKYPLAPVRPADGEQRPCFAGTFDCTTRTCTGLIAKTHSPAPQCADGARLRLNSRHT